MKTFFFGVGMVIFRCPQWITLPDNAPLVVHLPLSRAEARTLAAALLNAADAATG